MTGLRTMGLLMTAALVAAACSASAEPTTTTSAPATTATTTLPPLTTTLIPSTTAAPETSSTTILSAPPAVLVSNPDGVFLIASETRQLITGPVAFAVDDTLSNHTAALIEPGSEWNLQFWYRDPQPVGHGFNLTDALHATFCP